MVSGFFMLVMRVQIYIILYYKNFHEVIFPEDHNLRIVRLIN
jgi:hypothetical protein